jgi:hypothetical protein
VQQLTLALWRSAGMESSTRCRAAQRRVNSQEPHRQVALESHLGSGWLLPVDAAGGCPPPTVRGLHAAGNSRRRVNSPPYTNWVPPPPLGDTPSVHSKRLVAVGREVALALPGTCAWRRKAREAANIGLGARRIGRSPRIPGPFCSMARCSPACLAFMSGGRSVSADRPPVSWRSLICSAAARQHSGRLAAKMLRPWAKANGRRRPPLRDDRDAARIFRLRR